MHGCIYLKPSDELIAVIIVYTYIFFYKTISSSVKRKRKREKTFFVFESGGAIVDIRKG